MRTFAFITHPLNLKQLKSYWPVSRFIPDFLIGFVSKTVFSFKIKEIKWVFSRQGGKIQGYLIICPLLPYQIARVPQKHILYKMIDAAQIAERLQAKILGIGGCAAKVVDKEISLAKDLSMPMTNGSALTAWSVFEALYRITRIRKVRLGDAVLAVIGAANPIAVACAQKLAGYVRKIILVDSSPKKLELLQDKILDGYQVEIFIQEDTQRAFQEADLVITVSRWDESGITIKSFKPGSIVCDVSLSCLELGHSDTDTNVTVIQGGLIKLPCPINFPFCDILPNDVTIAALAETMLLTFERRFVNYSLGEDISPEKLDEIADIAVQHGFEVWVPQAPLL